MNRLIGFIVILAVFIASCKNSSTTSNQTQSNSVMTFENFEHDFGAMPHNGDGTYSFEFKNTGKDPLLIVNVKSSCGCTVPTYQKEPIKKGEIGTIDVKYNTKIFGRFKKSITVYSNAVNSPVVLQIKGEVLPKS